MDKLKVIELFAGVGGFRLGLEKKGRYKVVWSNQWEPSTKTQHASMVYEARFGAENHCNEDISEVATDRIPDADLLVGGFPCQDYSVATTLQNSKGLIGKKGVLWWSIHRILSEKKNPPRYLFLENVDRLLKSPSTQRGRDFAIMLKSLDELGYAVEWRVINAADYGMPQRRRRIFFLGYHKSTAAYKELKQADKAEWIQGGGTIAQAFPVEKTGPYDRPVFPRRRFGVDLRRLQQGRKAFPLSKYRGFYRWKGLHAKNESGAPGKKDRFKGCFGKGGGCRGVLHPRGRLSQMGIPKRGEKGGAYLQKRLYLQLQRRKHGLSRRPRQGIENDHYRRRRPIALAVQARGTNPEGTPQVNAPGVGTIEHVSRQPHPVEGYKRHQTRLFYGQCPGGRNN